MSTGLERVLNRMTQTHQPSIWSYHSLSRRRTPLLALITAFLIFIFTISLRPSTDLPFIDTIDAFDRIQSIAESLTGTSTTGFTPSADGDPYVFPTKQELRKMVGRRPKFFVKDDAQAFGYNNVRYMFETTLVLARLVGRIPVIPATMWCRRCAVESATCTSHSLEHFTLRNKEGKKYGLQWNDEGEAWRLGIEHFFDINHLRAVYGPFLTIEEYFILYDIDRNVFQRHGSWDMEKYTPKGLTIARMDSAEFETPPTVRVDSLNPSWRDIQHVHGGSRIRAVTPFVGSLKPPINPTPVSADRVRAIRGGDHVWTIEEAREKLKAEAGWTLSDDDNEVINELATVGFAPLYTFHPNSRMNKAVVTPSVEFALLENIVPWVEVIQQNKTWSKADIVYVSNGIHDQRKPGALRFSTPEKRDDFKDFVVKGMRPPQNAVVVGQDLANKMKMKVGKRRWVAAHMRRGDFINIDWAPNRNATIHFEATKEKLELGIVQLGKHYEPSSLPLDGDPFYLATDEEDPEALAYYRQHGAITLHDLLDETDKHNLGWQSAYVDFLALVEQQMMAHADFFVGSFMSSTTGGTLNQREALGQPGWSWSLL